MQTTTNYGFKKPEEGDYALISDINDNMDAIDEELASPTGDLAEATVETLTASTAEYPVPAASDSLKVIIGKITKFFADIVQTFTGATASAAGHKGLVPAPAKNTQNRYLRADGTWQELVNDHTTTTAGKALDARQANPNVSGSLGAQLKSLNDSLNALFVTEVKTVTTSITFEAGTIGSYVGNERMSIEKTGYKPIAVSLANNPTPGSYNLILQLTDTYAICHIYRATTSAVSSTGVVTARVLYMKQ